MSVPTARRGIREASTLFAFGHAGAYDTYLEGLRIVDLGDADIVHTDTMKSHANIEYGVRKILAAGALPVVLGGDHSVNIPCINAFSEQEPIHVVQFDAHLDFVDERHGVRFGHGSPLRRASEKPWVTGMTQLGIRNVSLPPRKVMIMPGRRAQISSRSARSASLVSMPFWSVFRLGNAIT